VMITAGTNARRRSSFRSSRNAAALSRETGFAPAQTAHDAGRSSRASACQSVEFSAIRRISDGLRMVRRWLWLISNPAFSQAVRMRLAV
jgi:hypothetical protein